MRHLVGVLDVAISCIVVGCVSINFIYYQSAIGQVLSRGLASGELTLWWRAPAVGFSMRSYLIVVKVC